MGQFGLNFGANFDVAGAVATLEIKILHLANVIARAVYNLGDMIVIGKRDISMGNMIAINSIDMGDKAIVGARVHGE